ncbi:MAG: tRNA preQ1(34) S-adenosylmethionine ribosyltransferase-isomerase QueA [Treponemataceae bacterium]|nr:tRNA preQ1(34) S-adenosylmethionine ribosyltransferase-isomerase QueA [Treponemataceae bacterium]
MKTSDFNFELPDELIAQTPSKIRGQDKLLLMDRVSGKIEHHMMADLPDLIDENTLMVFNNSKVRRSRCFAKKLQSKESRMRGEQASEKDVEFMVLSFVPDLKDQDGRQIAAWKCMVKNAKKQKAGCQYVFNDGTVGTIIENPADAATEFRTLVFDKNLDDDWFERNGHIPLPPYIKREDNAEDSERYQNVYAKELGSSACPTAGLHFTQEMLETLEKKGIEKEFVTLHVGLGTFLPVRVENIEEHKMHEEVFTISPETAKKITEAKRNGKKILAVGTTSVRTLESAWDTDNNCLKSGTYSTRIFIYPGYKFKVVDQLFTNFHTPESTLMMLVSAFSSREKIMKAYEEAVAKRYRFFSYGDACLFK